MPKVTKRLIYRRTIWNLPSASSLGSLIAKAMRLVPEGECKMLVAGEDEKGTWCKLVKVAVRSSGMVFGKLVQYTVGMEQETVIIAKQGEPQDEGSAGAPEGEEWSEGALMFCIDGDHVSIAQSQSMRASKFEAFANWLLARKTGLVGEGQALELEAVSRRDAARILEETEARSVTIGRVVSFGEQRVGVSDPGQKIITELLGVESLHDVLPRNAFSSGRIQTDVTFRWSKRIGGDNPKSTMKQLKKIALHQIDSDEDFLVKIDTPRGVLGKRELSLSKDIRIDAPDGRVPVTAVYQHLVDFLRELRTNREIVD